MKIRVNGLDADMQPETEKTVGEVLAAMESWLTGSGHRLSGLCIDGETANLETIEESFNREIDTIHTLDISTSSLTELIAESLFNIIEDVKTYEAASFEQRIPFAANWKESPTARLLAEQSPDLYDWAMNTFSGEGSGTQILHSLAEERLRELQNPINEMETAKPLVAEVCTRLEELPLDMQTGKDARAAETVNFFSGIAEKVFRIYSILKIEGFPVGDIKVENMAIKAYIDEFNAVLQELLTAYEQRDTVLVGDLAEYEMAPRLRNLHATLLDAIVQKRSLQ